MDNLNWPPLGPWHQETFAPAVNGQPDSGAIDGYYPMSRRHRRAMEKQLVIPRPGRYSSYPLRVSQHKNNV